jgi:hypothetical protein
MGNAAAFFSYAVSSAVAELRAPRRPEHTSGGTRRR